MPHKSRICQKTNCNKGKQIAKKWEKHAQIISQCLGAKSQSKAEFESLHSHPHQHQHSSVTHIVTWRCSGKCQLFAFGPGDLGPGPRTQNPESRTSDAEGCAVGLNTQQIACQQLRHKRQRIVARQDYPLVHLQCSSIRD